MAGVKHQVIQMIQSLPEDVTIDDVMTELYFKLQVDAGLRKLDEGKGIPLLLAFTAIRLNFFFILTTFFNTHKKLSLLCLLFA